ncbi:MAG: DNA-processing protein DprA [Sphaerochaetaceae bacterium]|nr:DNA-processing protein DprA [Spirochaetales bacterium]MDY5499090.1 DNA-processing protein DprA [Sphaerochaetaceae bacterium]
MDDHVRRALFYTVLAEAKDGSETTVLPVFNEVAGKHLKPETEFVECASKLSLSLKDLEPLIDSQYDSFANLDSSVRVISWEDPEWPSQTFGTAYCPRFLYLRGDISLLSRPMVSVIGTRTPDLSGKKLCIQTVEALGAKNLVVASGLALGIDGVAHMTALRMGFPTVCVIGTPITKYYPAEHQRLQDEIAAKGLVVSRFAPSLPTQKWYFLVRNRLMSSLSIASVIVEEKDGGGAISQAEYSLEQGRRVCFYQSTLDNSAILWPRKLSERNHVLVARTPISLAKALAPQARQEHIREKAVPPAPKVVPHVPLKRKRKESPVPAGQLSLF